MPIMASKVARWITRQPGWGDRLKATLRYLYKLSSYLEKCPGCGQLKKARRVKKAGPNKGRVFQVCDCRDRGPITWLPDEFTKGGK